MSSWNSRLEPPSGSATVVPLSGTTTLVPFSWPVRVSGLVSVPKLIEWLPEKVSIEATYLSFCQLKVDAGSVLELLVQVSEEVVRLVDPRT